MKKIKGIVTWVFAIIVVATGLLMSLGTDDGSSFAHDLIETVR